MQLAFAVGMMCCVIFGASIKLNLIFSFSVPAFICHDSGATVLTYAPKHQLLISGGRKGFICVFDLHQRQQRQIFQAHDSPVKAVAVDPTEEYFITGSAEGSMKVRLLYLDRVSESF